MEIWKDVVGFEEFYEVSSLGNVRSKERKYRNSDGRLITKHSKQLKPFGDTYLRVGLKVPGDERVYKKFVHILVAMAFIPNTYNKPTVNHKDNIKWHNEVSNLEWATYEEQIAHAVSIGARDTKKIAEKARESNSKPVIATNIFTNDSIEFSSITEAKKMLGLNSGVVNWALKHGNETSGWLFKYKV